MHITYVPGFFQHDTLPVGPDKGFRAHTLPELGILPKNYPTDSAFDPHHKKPQWARFEHYISHLNAQDPTRAKYKVFFVVRHGEGVHNVKEREVGRAEWEKTYVRKTGDETITWLNAPLTSHGEVQVQSSSRILQTSILAHGLPFPQKIYTSPLTRTLQTTSILHSSLSSPLPVIIKEALRETHGIHTCDRRGTLSSIKHEFPDFEVESGFTEKDDLWTEDKRETPREVAQRVRRFLDAVFEFDTSANGKETLVEDEWIMLVCHSGTIRGLYAATGHPEVWPAVGAVFPVVIKADLVE